MIDSISVNAVGTRNNRPRLVTAVWLCLFVVVTVTAITLRVSNREVASRSPDEQVYMQHYATHVAGSGIEGGRVLVQEYKNTTGINVCGFIRRPFGSVSSTLSLRKAIIVSCR